MKHEYLSTFLFISAILRTSFCLFLFCNYFAKSNNCYDSGKFWMFLTNFFAWHTGNFIISRKICKEKKNAWPSKQICRVRKYHYQNKKTKILKFLGSFFEVFFNTCEIFSFFSILFKFFHFSLELNEYLKNDQKVEPLSLKLLLFGWP